MSVEQNTTWHYQITLNSWIFCQVIKLLASQYRIFFSYSKYPQICIGKFQIEVLKNYKHTPKATATHKQLIWLLFIHKPDRHVLHYTRWFYLVVWTAVRFRHTPVSAREVAGLWQQVSNNRDRVFLIPFSHLSFSVKIWEARKIFFK